MESIDAAAVGAGMSDTGETDKTLLARSRDIVARLSVEIERITEDLSKARRDTMATVTRALHAEGNNEIALAALREECRTSIVLKRQRDEHRREICEMAAKSAFPSFTIRHAVCVGFARAHAKRRGWDCYPEAGDTTGGE